MSKPAILVSLVFTFLSCFSFSFPGTSSREKDGAVKDRGGVMVLRGPYLQCGTSQSMIVRWRTDKPTSSRVTYGKEFDQLDRSAESETLKTEHVMSIAGLSPDTKYYYEIGDMDRLYATEDSSRYFITSPGNIHDRPVRLWVLGDFGTGDETAKKVKRAYYNFIENKHTDVWLMLGDIAYYHGKDTEFQRSLFDDTYDEFLVNTVSWPTPGNHDCRNANSRQQSGPYYDIFSLPTNGEAGGYPSKTEAYYSFDYNNIHFVSLDSEESAQEAEEEMITWLYQDLEQNEAEWLIVFFHHPPYTKGTHDSDSKFDSGGRMIDVRENILPIIESYDADLVLSGHSHVYERSHLIHQHYGFSETFDEDTMIKVEGVKKHRVYHYAKPKGDLGTMYIVCGIGCHKPSHAPMHHPAMSVGSNLHVGSLSIEVQGNRLTGKMINSKGKIKDQFVITKEY